MTLTEIRDDKNLSLREVAERMGCSHVSVLKLEASKNPRLFTLKKYAEAIGEPFTSLVDTLVKNVN